MTRPAIERTTYPGDGATIGFRVEATYTQMYECDNPLDVYTAHIYLGSEIAWSCRSTWDRSTGYANLYDSLDHFAAHSMRRFTQRLSDVLEQGT